MGGSQSYDKPAEVASKHFPAFRAAMPRMDGKVVAITGCTSGTGFITAKACAEQGARVLMLNRPSSRADEAFKKLKEAAPEAQISQIPCDLMSFDSVRDAAKAVDKELKGYGLDVLCNNAGIMATADEATKDGCDTQMQTNHLSHFLLTAESWPLLEKAAELRGEARVVSHSSGARKRGGDGFKELDEKYLQKNGGNLGGDEQTWMPFSGGRWTRYQQTKLANLVFTYALRDRLAAANSKVKALVAHPGLSSTNLQVTTTQDGGMSNGFSNRLMGWMAQSGEDGTVGLLTCVSKPDVKNGEFYGPAGLTGPAILLPVEPEEKIAPESSRKMLWEVSSLVTGAHFPF